jgi:hypothetical protein
VRPGGGGGLQAGWEFSAHRLGLVDDTEASLPRPNATALTAFVCLPFLVNI